MGWILQLSSAILALVTLLTGILKLASISKVTRIEKTLMTDYKRTLIAFMEAFVVVILLSLGVVGIVLLINSKISLESVVAAFLVAILYISVILWVVYQGIVIFRKKRVRYYIEENDMKLYIHKSTSDSEIILSHGKELSDNSNNIQIRERSYLYDKTIRKEII